jgi:Chaperone for flagella basal body P-ring formation
MKPTSIPLVWIVLVSSALCPRDASTAPASCGRIRVRAEVEVAGGDVTLANILDAGTCSTVVRAASRVRLGAAPLAGSPRVLRGDEVRALVESLGSEKGFEASSPSIPERVTIRRSERLDCSNLAARLAVPSGDESEKQSRNCTARSSLGNRTSGNSAEVKLVRRGERVTLEWDSSGIRITVPAVSLDAGALGERVRARIEPNGRMMRALVVDRGQLRAGS